MGEWPDSIFEQDSLMRCHADYFRPNTTITRAELVMILMNGQKLTSKVTTLKFSDAPMIPAWVKSAIAQSVESGIVSGYGDGSFRPFANMKRIVTGHPADRKLHDLKLWLIKYGLMVFLKLLKNLNLNRTLEHAEIGG